MNKISFVFLIIFVTAFVINAQTDITKSETAPKNPSPMIEREKFDPTRDPAADLQAAVVKARAENKRIILDVGGEWCIWCRWMDEYFIKNADLAALRDENFIWLKINMSRENENTEFLSKYPAAAGYPHLYVLEKDGSLLHSQPTNVLEEAKSYNKERVTAFLKKWALEKKTETKIDGRK